MIGNPNRERPSNREQFGFIRVANTYNATMHWSYGSPQQRPFTYNVILMMAPSLWAVITLGLFYCPNHKLSTPQFIRTWLNLVQGSCLVCINILVKIQHRPLNPATAFAPNHFNMTNANQSNIKQLTQCTNSNSRNKQTNSAVEVAGQCDRKALRWKNRGRWELADHIFAIFRCDSIS